MGIYDGRGRRASLAVRVQEQEQWACLHVPPSLSPPPRLLMGYLVVVVV